MARYETATTIINNAAKELGLWTATVADPYSGANPLAAQLCALLNRCGRSLAMMDWPQLVREHLLTGDGTTSAFTLPGDFRSLVSDASWDRTNGFHIAPTNAQQWQYLKASSLGSTIVLQARIISDRTEGHADKIQFVTAPASAAALAIEYRSRNWVQLSSYVYGGVSAPTAGTMTVSISGTPTALPEVSTIEVSDAGDCALYYTEALAEVIDISGLSAATSVTATIATATGMVGSVLTFAKVLAAAFENDSYTIDLDPDFGDSATTAGDTVLFDPALAVAALKLAFKREKSLDTATAEQDYREALDACRGDLVMAGTLSLSGGSDVHLIDTCNVPETGIGS